MVDDRAPSHHGCVSSPPFAFASSEPLADLRADGGPRLPRPSRLASPLKVSPAPAAKGA